MPRARRRLGASFAICLLATVAFVPGVAATMRCLSPDAGRVVGDVLATGAVQRQLPEGFRVDNVDIGAQTIALAVSGGDGTRYDVTLRVTPAGESGRPKFTVAVGDGSHRPPRDVGEALAAAAKTLGDGVPDTVLVDCSSSADDPGGRAAGPESRRALTLSPALALLSAAAEVSVIVAAIVFGLAAIGRAETDGRG